MTGDEYIVTKTGTGLLDSMAVHIEIPSSSEELKELRRFFSKYRWLWWFCPRRRRRYDTLSLQWHYVWMDYIIASLMAHSKAAGEGIGRVLGGEVKHDGR